MIWKKTRYLDAKELAVIVDGRQYIDQLNKAARFLGEQ